MIKVFEAFSGIGTQRMALKNINIDYEIVATSEIDINAIKAYSYIHHFDDLNKPFVYPEIEEIKNFLYKKNIGSLNIEKIDKLHPEKIKEIYKYCVLNKNLGDISKINPDEIPQHDLFTYSFPCQDLSTFGYGLGCSENSGTRSSLLWSCKKIIEAKKPRILLLENVKNLIGKTHLKNFNKWLSFLKDNGYINFYSVLDSSNYEIPQRRKRVFVVSFLKISNEDIHFNFPEALQLNPLENFITPNLNFLSYSSHIDKVDFSKASKKINFLDDRDWNFNGIIISDICPTLRAGRSGIKICKLNEENKLVYRNITPNESWRLMGINDSYFKKVTYAKLSAGVLFKLAGNAIVVNVLEEIFKNIFLRRIKP